MKAHTNTTQRAYNKIRHADDGVKGEGISENGRERERGSGTGYHACAKAVHTAYRGCWSLALQRLKELGQTDTRPLTNVCGRGSAVRARGRTNQP